MTELVCRLRSFSQSIAAKTTFQEKPRLRAWPLKWQDRFTEFESSPFVGKINAELDGAIEDQSEQTWLDEAERRYLELIEGKVQAITGDEVLARLQSRL